MPVSVLGSGSASGLGLSAVALVASLTAFAVGVRLHRRRHVGLAAVLFVAGTTSLVTGLGLAALTLLAWH